MDGIAFAREPQRTLLDGAVEAHGARGELLNRGGDVLRAVDDGKVRQAGERGNPLDQVVGDLPFGERVQDDLFGKPMQSQLVANRAHGLVGGGDLGEATAAQPHEARGTAPAGDVVHELDGGLVAPVQVLGHQQQGVLLGVAIEQLAHLARHARLPPRR